MESTYFPGPAEIIDVVTQELRPDIGGPRLGLRDGGLENAGLLVAELALLASVRVQTAHRNPGPGQGEIMRQRLRCQGDGARD